VSREGDPVEGQRCPRCGRYTVVYNGNYFCANAVCPWIMGENVRPARIVKAYLSQRWLRAQAAGDRDEMDRLGRYLREFADA
jgi:hypothetical protein